MKKAEFFATRYDKIFARVSGHWNGSYSTRDPVELQKRVVETTPGSFGKNKIHPSQKRIVVEFCRMPKAKRVEYATDYFRRHPPPPTLEEMNARKLRENPWLHVFIADQCAPGANIYDARAGEFILQDAQGGFVWSVHPPWAQRKIPPFCLRHMLDLPQVLIRLAIAQGMAFKIDTSDLKNWHRKFDFIFASPGDDRLQNMAHTFLEVEGIPRGQTLLFDKHDDFTGLLSEYKGAGQELGASGEKYSMFAVTVWERFYAVEIGDKSFRERPEFPA